MASFTRNAKNVVPLPERKKHPGLWGMLHAMARALPSRSRPAPRANPFQPAKPLPGVVAKDEKHKVPQIAMDAAEAYKTIAEDGFRKLAQDDYDGAISSGGGWIAGSGQGYYGSAYAEGQEWLGVFHIETKIEFTVLGDTINHAARLSDFARQGALWATKNLMGKLSAEERNKVRFGVRRHDQERREVFVKATYSRVSELVDLDSPRHEKMRDISALAVTEIVEVA